MGQCAVHVGRRKVTFLDKIQLLPSHRHLNRRCFDFVMRQFGDVAYKYGSRWNDEDEFDFERMSRFDVDSTIFHVDLIEFRDWPDFAAYRRGVSENIRRDYKKAKEVGAIVKTDYGLKGFRDLFALIAMRRHMIRRNNLSVSRILDYLSHAGRILVLGKKSFVTTVKINGKVYAAFFGVEVGSRLYYISGGTRRNHLGAGSYLFLTLIESWFSKHPKGEFLMGDCPESFENPEHDGGNVLYRRKLRVRSVNGVEFRLTPKQTAGAAAPRTQGALEDAHAREDDPEYAQSQKKSHGV